MTERRTIFLDTKRGREHASRMAFSVPDDWVARYSERTRTDDQNKAMWARIRDLREQIPEMGEYSPEQVKLRFLDALGHEMVFLPKLEDAGMFPVGYRSSTLTVEQFGALLTLMDEYGARHGVVWTDDRESDRSPQGGNSEAGSVHESAAPQGFAQKPSTQSRKQHD